MNPLKLAPVLLILPVLFSCTQKSTLEIATGKVTTIKLGNVVRIKEINVLTSTDDGTFANMAGTAAEAMTPGIIGMDCFNFLAQLILCSILEFKLCEESLILDTCFF